MTSPKFFLSHPRRPTNQVNYNFRYEEKIKENIEEADAIAKYDLKGLNLVEPFKVIPQDGSVDECEAMERCIRLLLDCDGIILSGDWKKSYGCKLEHHIAKATGKIVLVLK